VPERTLRHIFLGARANRVCQVCGESIEALRYRALLNQVPCSPRIVRDQKLSEATVGYRPAGSVDYQSSDTSQPYK
jgi:hypothetical protein